MCVKINVEFKNENNFNFLLQNSSFGFLNTKSDGLSEQNN